MLEFVASFSKEEDEHCRLSLKTVAKIKAPKIDKVFIAVKEQRTELTGPVELLHDSLMLGTWDSHFLSASEANALLHIYISNRVLSLFFGSYLSFPRHFYQVIWVQIDSISSKIDSKRFNHFITKRINLSSNTFNWFKYFQLIQIVSIDSKSFIRFE